MKKEKFWDKIDNSVKEYLAMRYYKTTRCLLKPSQIEHISKQETLFMEIDHLI